MTGALQDEGKNDQTRASLHVLHRLRLTWITLVLGAEVPIKLVAPVTGDRTVGVILKHTFIRTRGAPFGDRGSRHCRKWRLEGSAHHEDDLVPVIVRVPTTWRGTSSGRATQCGTQSIIYPFAFQ